MTVAEIHDSKKIHDMMKQMETLTQVIMQQQQQLNAIGNKLSQTEENERKDEDKYEVIDAVEKKIEKVGRKEYQFICGTEDIGKILKCILDATLFVIKLLKRLLNIRNEIKNTLKNIPLVSTIVFIIDILVLWCYIYVICLVINYIGCKIGNPKLAEDVFRIWVRYTIKLFEFACNPKVIENTMQGTKTVMNIIHREISTSDFAVQYQSGKEIVAKNVNQLKSVLNFVNNGIQTMKDGNFSNVVINKVKDAASTISEGTYNTVSTTTSDFLNTLQDVTMNAFYEKVSEPEVQKLVVGDMTFIIEGGKKTQKKRRKRKKTIKRKPKSKRVSFKGGVQNNIMDNLVATLPRINDSDLKKPPLKHFQKLVQLHDAFATPIFDLVYKCIEVSEKFP